MTKRLPFRFGVVCETMQSRNEWIAKARRAEENRYATLLLRDHFTKEPFGDQFAPIAALMAAADATTTLRVGSLVFDNDYRHPVLLAKEVATLDVLSGGRVELGLGAGWLDTEYQQAGLPFDPPGIRISRFEEALHILKSLLAGNELTFSGTHYTVTNLRTFPQPVQKPHPPILIGGGGKRMLSLAAQHANSIGIMAGPLRSSVLSTDPAERSAEHMTRKIDWIRQAAGERFDEIELNMVISPIFAENQRQSAERIAHERGWSGLSAEDVLDMPSVFIGTTEQIAEQIYQRRQSYGFSYYVVSDSDMETFAPVVALLAGK